MFIRFDSRYQHGVVDVARRKVTYTYKKNQNTYELTVNRGDFNELVRRAKIQNRSKEDSVGDMIAELRSDPANIEIKL